jgi:hypothetical protein
LQEPVAHAPDAYKSITPHRPAEVLGLPISPDLGADITNPGLSPDTSTEASFSQYPKTQQLLHFTPFSRPSATVEDVSLNAGELDSYMSYFFENMHCHFPFLERPFLQSETLSSSPLLFWTIIAISSGFQNRALYRELQPIVRRLLALGIFPFAGSQEICQALCLLCLWPFEASQPNDDPTFLYSGMASHIAMQIGLHRPQFKHEFKNVNEPSVKPQETPSSRWMTWCACVFVEHQQASKVGVPSSVRDHWVLQQSLNHTEPDESPQLPCVLRKQLLLALLRDRYMIAASWDGATASGLCEPPTRLSILQLFSSELDHFEARSSPLETTTSVLVNATRVHIAGFCLAADMALVEHQALQTTIILLLRRGIASAAAILDILTPLPWETLPVHILRAILHAGLLIAQLLCIQRELESSTNKDLARGLRSTTWNERTSLADGSDLIGLLDRAIGILRFVSYGQDFSTRGKLLLEALRRGATTTEARADEHGSERQANDANGNFERNILNQRHLDPRGVTFQSRMSANMYWGAFAFEYAKGTHNWTQSGEDIILEMQSGLQ